MEFQFLFSITKVGYIRSKLNTYSWRIWAQKMKDEYLLVMIGKQFPRDGANCTGAVELFMKLVKQKENKWKTVKGKNVKGVKLHKSSFASKRTV